MKRVVSFVLSFLMLFTTVFSGNIFTAENVEAAASPAYRNVMYYGEWSIYAGQKNFTVDKIAGNYITHLNFAFLDVDENGNVISCDTWADFENPNVGYSATSDSPWAGVAAAMIQLRNQYPNMKIGFSVGGWTRSGDFPAVAASETKRKAFAENIAKIAHLYGYDFVDIDWEYPTADRDPDPEGNGVTVDKGCKGSAEDKHNFTLLLQDLRAALDKYDAIDNKHYELSVAMSASPAMMAQIEYDQVLNIVDFANMMTYDLNGAWNAYTGHQTALFTNEAYDHATQTDGQFSVDACIQYLYDTYGNEIDPSKIVVGIAPYTRGWAGVKNDGPDSSNPGLYATAEPNSVKAADGTTSGTFAFGDIDTLISQYGLKEYYDETAQAAYYYSESTGYFFTCDNERSVTAKAEYVKNGAYKNPFDKPLGGLISWMASLDSASLITKTSHDALFGAGTVLPDQDIVFPSMDNITASVTTSGNDYIITIKNNNTVSTPKTQGTLHGSAEANVLYYAETFAGTATYPKFYIKTSDGAELSGSAWSAGGTIGKSGDYTTVQYGTWPYYLGPSTGQYSTITLTLTSSTTPDVSKITEIGMTRKATSDGEEFGYTVLLGDSSDTPVTDNPTTQAAQTTTQAAATTQAAQTTTQSVVDDGNKYPAWSPDNVAYKLGDIVAYNGAYYECIYAHNSNSGWTPSGTPTLWKERTDLKYNGVETTESDEGSGGDNNYYVNSVLPDHIITGYWHNFCNGAANLKLSQVPEYYDLICVAFAASTATAGEVAFELDSDLCTAVGGYTKAEFIQDIKDLKAKGQHVILSVGGAEGTIYINSDEASQKFAESLISVIEEYGFEGVDIDLEGSAVSGVEYIASALRKVHDHFGDDFIITMAPETIYMQSTSASYFKLALEIKDILTIVNMQFYNSGSMIGYGGGVYTQGTVDFLTSLATLLIENGLRPDQVGIGVPATTKAAGGGYVTPETLISAVNCMVYGTKTSGSFTPPKTYPAFRGVMTWSINWDATENYAWASALAPVIAGLPETDKPEEPTTQAETEAQVSTTQAVSTGKYDLIVTDISFGSETVTAGTQVVFTATVKNNGNADIPSGTPIGVQFQVDGNTSAITWCDSYSEGLKAGQSVNLTCNSGTDGIKYWTATEGTHSITAWVDDVNRWPDEADENNNKLTKDITVTADTPVTTQAATEPTTQGQTAAGNTSTLLIGYYHTWDNSGNPFIKLRDVDENWDVINIAFAEPVSAGSTDGRMQFNISGLTADYTKDDFKQDIKDLQAQGKKIVLSIGGYEGYFSLTSQAAADQFVSDIKSIVDEYGFDGIDIDLEQSSVQFESGNDPDINNPTSPKIVNMINAIRTIVNSYGDDFILSWAPETFYVQMGYQYYGGINQYCDSRAGVYLPMINALRDETTYVHVQLYNSAPMMGTDNQSYNMGTKEGIVAMCRMLLEGFYVNNYYTESKTAEKYFAPLRPDQVVIGVPASASAAGSGQVSNEVLQSAFTELNNEYPGIRGIMTWSINWDSSQNGNSFAKENGSFLDKFNNDTPVVSTEAEETTKAEEPTTEAPVTEEPTTKEAVSLPFTDVPKDYWAYDSIAECYMNGWIVGTTATTFSPDDTVTRAQFMTILGRFDGADVSSYTSSKFVDVSFSSWGYAPYVAWAEANGIANGTDSTHFSPYSLLTRAQIMVFLSNYAKYAGIELESVNPDIEFSDYNSIPSYARAAVMEMAQAGVISGDSDKFDPNSPCSRAMVAEFLVRFNKALNGTIEGPEEPTTEEPATQAPETTKAEETTEAPETEEASTEETSSGDAEQYPEWNSESIYVKDDYVLYEGHVYIAKWWNQNSIPGAEEWGPWELIK